MQTYFVQLTENEESKFSEDEHQQKSDEAYQKWLIKKEKEKLEHEESLLEEERIRRKKLEEKLQAAAVKNKQPTGFRPTRRASVI